MSEVDEDAYIEAEAISRTFDIDSGGFSKISKSFNKTLIDLGSCIPHKVDVLLRNLLHDIFDDIYLPKSGEDVDEDVIDERKRVFCKDPKDLDGLAILLDTQKNEYKDGDKEAQSYIKRKISEGLTYLDENNIVHIWKCKRHYMYYLEKDSSYWLVFKGNAVFTPAILLKLINQSRHQIEIMIKKRLSVENPSKIKNDVKREQRIQQIKQEVYDSYYADFLVSRISRMCPEASEELSNIKYTGDLDQYLIALEVLLKGMDKFRGYQKSLEYRAGLQTISNLVKKKAKLRLNLLNLITKIIKIPLKMESRCFYTMKT
jgi:hypothetical protein